MFEKAFFAAILALVPSFSARQILDILDVALAQGTPVSRDVANVLSAIRGIDKAKDVREPIKTVSTAVIRANAFPLTAASAAAKVILAWTVAPGTVVRTTGDAADGHFNRHVKQAARALGLTVKTGLR